MSDKIYDKIIKRMENFMDKFCSNCGKKLKEGADVCLNCGKQVVHHTKNKTKDLDKKFIIAIIVGAIGFVLIIFFWFWIAIFSDLEDGYYTTHHSSRKSCCIKAGGKWSNNKCVYGNWFDDEYYDDCTENSF